jgi:hypothetical protein
MWYTNIEIIYRLTLGTHFILTQALNKILNLFCRIFISQGFHSTLDKHLMHYFGLQQRMQF